MYVPPMIHKFDYPNLTRIDGKPRMYVTDTGNLPSVTTILSATASEESKQALANWRTYVGDTQADAITKEACDIGTLMHENLENRLLRKQDHEGGMPMRVLARRMADSIQENAWPKIEEIWGQEVKLYYGGLWAGTTDIVGLYNGVPTIMDYKNSRRVKTRDDVEGYFTQGCAYALAHNQMFGTDIRSVAIFMCVRKDPKNLQYLEFSIEGDEFDHYQKLWVQKVTQYYTQLGAV